MSHSLWLLLRRFRREQESKKRRAADIRRSRFEQLEPRAMLSAATVNWNDVRQTIDGFGASSAWMWSAIPTAALTQLYSTTTGAGLSLLRSHIYPQGWSSETSVMQQVAPYGATVWSAPWSPPREWKTNNDNNHGGYLDPAHYQDYATQLANYALNMKALGVPLYAISLQNEPDMNVDYESCLWTEDQFAAFMPIVGETFAARGVTTKIMLPENSNWSFDKANSIMANPELSQYVGILAAHNYDRTYHPYVAVNGTGGLPLWQTEVFLGDGVSEITDALTLSNDIHKALTIGGASAYHYWWLSTNGVGGLMSSSWTPSKRLWAMGQYSRFVRPGWVMIGETDDGGLDITTFRNPATGEFAIVASNSGAASISETFTFNGFSAGVVTPYITSGAAGDDIKQYADIATTGGVSFVGVVPAYSIITYTGISSAAPALQAPTSLRALPQYQNLTTQIALSWDDNSTTEANYTVERSTDGHTWTVVASTLAANTISFVDAGRTENTLYYYRVKATNGAANSPYSDVVTGRTILDAPWGIGTWGSNPNGVNLGWNNSSTASTGVTIERSLDGLTWTLIATLPGGTTAYSDNIPGYNPNQLYCYRIRNTAGAVVSGYASYNTALKAPTSFTASSIGATQITFTWVNNTGSSTGNWIEQYNSGSWTRISPTNLAGSANSYTVTGLTERTTYRFRLRSSAAADSIWSSYTAEANPTTLFAAPTNLTAVAVTSTQTNLAWTDNSAIETNYTVERSTDGVSWSVLTSTLAANTNSYTDNSTPTGMVYYRVKAATSTASSSYATTQRITAAPVITATPNPVAGTSVALSVPALVGFGNGNLTYAWSTIGTPPAPVAFSVNGTSASNNTTATFTKSGVYIFRIVVADSAGVSTTSTLGVVVNQTLAAITVTANGGAIVKSTWQQCTATAYDQFGNAMTTQPTFTWSVVSGGGSITTAGLYQAPASAAAPVVRAASGSVSGQLTLSVLDTAQLKAVYSFNEGAGYTARDLLGVGVDGILSWGVNYTTGRLGNALQFDGSTGSVWMGNPASLDIVGQITLAAWIRPTSSSGIQNIVGHSYGLWPNQAETVLRINAGRYEVGIWNGANTFASYTVPAGDINNWVHLVGTYDGKTWRLYRNGIQVATAATSIGSMHVLRAWRIGSSDFPDRYFSGCIDSVRIYAQALSAGEIAALAAQRIVVTSSATASPNPVIGATTNLSVAAVDPDANSDVNFTYTWSTTGTPPAPVGFSANGSNAAKNTTAAFTRAGSYSFLVTITDAAGLSTTSSASVAVNSTVAGREVFYNGSKFDSISDGDAIAADKEALLPGGTAAFANYTSYSRGINGIMVDINRLPVSSLTKDDFVFKVGNDGFNWLPASVDPISITVVAGQGANNSDRVTVIWDDNVIENEWLQVTVKANTNTGLAADDVFYFGNLIGESGDSPTMAAVDLNDEIASRTHKTGFSAATIVNLYDYNRDGKVNTTDDLIARSNASNALELITPAAGPLAETDALQPVIFAQAGAPALTPVASADQVAAVASAEASPQIPQMTLPPPAGDIVGNPLRPFLSDSLQRPAEPIALGIPHHSSISRFARFQSRGTESHQGLIAKSNLPDAKQCLLHDAAFSSRSNWVAFVRHRLPRRSTATKDLDVSFEDHLSVDYGPRL